MCYLNDLLEQAEKGAMVDPTLLHYCYAFITSHVFGSRPEGIVTVTELEMEHFADVKERLRSYLESQVIIVPARVRNLVPHFFFKFFKFLLKKVSS